jgi:hypothetical protein
MRQQINRFIRRVTATESRPEIRWSEVIRIEALGTDALGAFEVSLTFIYESGAQTTVSPHHKGYDEILDELRQRFPSIPMDWFVQMSQQPWHVERVLYSGETSREPCTHD